MDRQATEQRIQSIDRPHSQLLTYYVLSSLALGPLFPILLNDTETRTALIVSANCWFLAFILYVVVNAKYLLTPRPDGKEG